MCPETSPPLVLLVEDSEDLREALEAFLVSRKYRVVMREDVDGALEAMRAERPELVLTDIFLGQSCGLDLITAIRSDFSVPPPIIACSGMPEMDRVALERGADLFLPKPLVPDMLAKAMADLLGARVPSRQLLQENAARSHALRTRHVEAARTVMARLAPQRATIYRQIERDTHWLSAFLGLGNAIVSLVDGECLSVAATSDPGRWPRDSPIESYLPLCRHVLETGSTFLLPDLSAIAPTSGTAVPGPRFVAAFPLCYGDTPIGVLCLVDDDPAQLDPADFGMVEALCRYFSARLSDERRPLARRSQLMRRHALEAVVGSEFDRAVRFDLTVHFFAFASTTPPPDLFAERTLVADLGEGRFGMIITRSSADRSPRDMVAAVRCASDLPGFGGGDLLSIEVSAAPRLGDHILLLADKRLDERVARGTPPTVDRVVLRHEALDEAS